MNTETTITVQLPAGFDKVDAAADLPPAIEWTLGQVFIGTLKRIQTVRNTKTNPPKDMKAMVFDTEHGPRTVWESAGLRGVLEIAQPGQTWWLAYVADKDTGQPSPMKIFQAGVKRA